MVDPNNHTYNIQLDDLVYTYPDENAEDFQTLITSKQEFLELSPQPGQLFGHQKLVQRYMLEYDRLLVIHETGTGKSCTAFSTSEQFKVGMVSAVVNFIDDYIKPQRTSIRHIYILTRSNLLIEELKFQLACKCTQGEYLTRKVQEASSETARKGNLTREINKYYSMFTYKTFINRLIERNLSDDDLRTLYSGSLFIVDEAHNLHIDPQQDSQESQRIIYNQLWRLFHVIERSKIMLLTATPMINEVAEIAPIMNLILPEESQLSLDTDYTTVTLQDMEPYFRGKISYVRALSTGAIVEYEGNPVEMEYEVAGKVIPSNLIVYATEMSEFQQQSYITTENTDDAFFSRGRQAANFVFPDGSFGRVGFDRYVIQEQVQRTRPPRRRDVNNGQNALETVTIPDRFRATEELVPWISSLENLRILSSKFASIVELCMTQPGNCFVYTDFISGSGGAVLALCFENMTINVENEDGEIVTYGPLEQFHEDTSIFLPIQSQGRRLRPLCASATGEEIANRRVRIDPRPRYAIITGKMPETRSAAILEAFNSYENRHGDYIKVLIGTPVSKIGINLANVLQVHVMGPQWNQSNTYQAISRAIRATSHVALVEEERQRLIAEGQNPDEARIVIRVYAHASVTTNGTSADLQMYQESEIKDIQIRRMLRIMKQCAIDCQINYSRNVRPGDIDGSPACDYQECQYQCVNPSPTTIDTSSYNVLYADKTISEVADYMKTIFITRFRIPFTELYTLLPDINPQYIVRAAEYLISQKIAIIDRYGYPSYLQEDKGTLYLQRQYPDISINQSNLGLSVYTDTLIALDDRSFSTFVSEIQTDTQLSQLEQLRSIPPSTPEFNDILDNLLLETKVNLLEESLYNYAINGTSDPFIESILERFRPFIYFLNEPVSDIERSAAVLANRGKGRGRKPKEGGRVRIRRVTATESIATPTPDTDTELVYIHTLYNQTFDRVSYAVTSKFIKAEGRIRILKPSENTGWRDANPYEFPVYNSYVQREILRRLSEFEQSEIYGTILQADRKFRIVDRTTQTGDPEQDARKTKRGKECRTWHKPDLIEVLWKLGVQPEVTVDPTLTQEQLVGYLNREKAKSDEVRPEEFDMDKLRFFYGWYLTDLTKDRLCTLIQEYLASIGRLFIM